jgi:hypothetical protein
MGADPQAPRSPQPSFSATDDSTTGQSDSKPAAERRLARPEPARQLLFSSQPADTVSDQLAAAREPNRPSIGN